MPGAALPVARYRPDQRTTVAAHDRARAAGGVDRGADVAKVVDEAVEQAGEIEADQRGRGGVVAREDQGRADHRAHFLDVGGGLGADRLGQRLDAGFTVPLLDLRLPGFSLAFTSAAVVLAQLFVAAPFFIRAARGGFARVEREIEDAAAIDGATPWQTFRLITLPLAMPGIIAAAMLAFSLSFDDFIVTNFTAGQSVTFPLFVYGSKLKEFPPQLFVVGTLMFFVSFVFVAGAEVWRRRGARRA